MPSGRDWFRLYNRMTQDPKIQHLSDYEFRLIIHIWCLASESSERGVVYVAPGIGYEPEILARGAGCREGDPVAALGVMEKLQLIKVDDNGVIHINNWDKLQYEFESWTPEARRKQKAKERSRKKLESQQPQGVNGDTNSSNANMSQVSRNTDTDTDTDTDSNKNICVFDGPNPDENAPAEKPEKGGAQRKAGKGNYSPEFEEFWSFYPRRVEKQGAYKAWNTRLKEGVSPDLLITASKNYAISCRENGTEDRFIKHAKTFLGPSKPYEDYLHGPILNNHRAPPAEPKGFKALREYISEEGIH